MTRAFFLLGLAFMAVTQKALKPFKPIYPAEDLLPHSGNR